MAFEEIVLGTETVQEIQSGRKTQVIKVIRKQPSNPRWNDEGWHGWDDGHGFRMRPPCEPGDILWVRETWAHPLGKDAVKCTDSDGFVYKADSSFLPSTFDRWHPSVNMPKHAARIFLRVKGVRIAQMKDIHETCAPDQGKLWAWVIDFERCEKPWGGAESV